VTVLHYQTLDQLQGSVVVPDSLVKNDGAQDPVTIPRQLALESLSSIDETNMSRRVPETTTTLATAARHLESLARVDEIRVADVVDSGNLIERGVEAACNASESVTVLNSNLGGTTVMSASRPTEASSVVLEELIEGDGGVLVVAVLALAGSVEDVIAVSIESDVSG
jgi:hypothetical protein